MKKIYHLASCTTNQRILKEWGKKASTFKMQEIKTEPITKAQLEEMHKLAGSYEALFSRIALKFRSMGLNKMKLSEDDYKRLILEEYTFLKRPVMINGDKIYIGNAPKVVAAAKESL